MKRTLLQIWKRTNRGLLAAGLLLLCLSIYLTVDGLSFQREKKAIEQTVREYVEVSPQLAQISPLLNLRNATDTQEELIDSKMEQNETLLRKYWSFHTDNYGYNQGETLLRQVRDVVTYNAQNTGSIESAKGIVQYIHSITKTGPNRAEIQFSYTGSVKYTGNVKWVLFNASPVEETDEFTLYLSIGDVIDGSSTDSESASPSGDVTAQMVKQDGRWLIDRVTYANVSGG